MDIDLQELIRLRHWLHAHPEISRHEQETAKYLRGILKDMAPPDRIVPLYGAGFAAVYEGTAQGKTVMIRCELDALPIHEVNVDLPYRSQHDGVGHKCGHDGHMSIVAGVAQTLGGHRPAKGRVVLLFQPDEETGTGALSCVTHKNFAQIEPDYVFALHNLPGFEQGTVICRQGTFASQVKYAAILFEGKEAHSAQPETGASPALAMAELTLVARDVQARHDAPEAYALAVPVYGQMGVQASGIAPGQGQVQFTLRGQSDEIVAAMWSDLCAEARRLARTYGLDVHFATKEEFAAVANSAQACGMIRKAATLSDLSYHETPAPFRWGEDFGELTQRYPGGMFGLGAGLNRPDLHNPDYDFPDDILGSGIAMFCALIRISLADGEPL